MAEETEPLGPGGGLAEAGRGALRAVLGRGSVCRGCWSHTDRGAPVPGEAAICVISQQAPLNLSLIKQWQYGPDMKEPSLKRADCVGRNSLFNCSQGPAVGGTRNQRILPSAEQESGDE